MAVEVRQAPEQERALIKSLMIPYIAELQQYEDRPGAYNGLPAQLPLYWSNPDYYPFTIWSDGQFVGFGLVRRTCVQTGTAMEVDEFFIKPEYECQGIGTAAAVWIWKKFPGKWELAVTKKNAKAVSFWSKCIRDHSLFFEEPEEFPSRGGCRLRFLFEVQ